MSLFSNVIIEHTPKGYKWSVNTTRCPKYYSTFEECQAEGMYWSKNYEPLTIEEADDIDFEDDSMETLNALAGLAQ